jgi:hypothetical protein
VALAQDAFGRSLALGPVKYNVAAISHVPSQKQRPIAEPMAVAEAEPATPIAVAEAEAGSLRLSCTPSLRLDRSLARVELRSMACSPAAGGLRVAARGLATRGGATPGRGPAIAPAVANGG